MGFFKDLFSPNPWNAIDSDWSFRNQLMGILGTLEFSKFDGILRMYKALDNDFFQSGKFSSCPENQKLTFFVSFVEDWIQALRANGLTKDAHIAAYVCEKLKSFVGGRELPQWYKGLPEHLRPSPQKLTELENLRTRLSLDHDIFLMGIANSPWAVIKAQEATLEQFRRGMPRSSERDLWRAVILSRFEIKLKAPSPWDPSPEHLLQKMESIDSVMSRIRSWQDVIKYVLEMDKDGFSLDPSGIQDEINEVLFR